MMEEALSCQSAVGLPDLHRMRGLGLPGRGRQNLGEEGVTWGAPLGTLGSPEARLWEGRHPSTLCFSVSVQRTLGVTQSVAGLAE